jgi:hypothetical protein
MIDISTELRDSQFLSQWFYKQCLSLPFTDSLYDTTTGIHMYVYGYGYTAQYLLFYASTTAHIYNWCKETEMHCFCINAPKKAHQGFDAKNINSGFSIPDMYSVVFRTEEIEKVIIHETLHLMKIHKLNYPTKLNESFVEAVATIIRTAIESRGDTHTFQKYMNLQRKHCSSLALRIATTIDVSQLSDNAYGYYVGKTQLLCANTPLPFFAHNEDTYKWIDKCLNSIDIKESPIQIQIKSLRMQTL